MQNSLFINPGAIIAVALSGGLDSLMAAWELKQAGHSVVGLHARLLEAEDWEAKRVRLEEACAFVGMPLEVADLRAAFRTGVIEPFVKSYAAGLTPNPCALCNPGLKFGLLLEHALALGADLLATGHYARKGEWAAPGISAFAGQSFATIYPAADQSKDQAYFLALVPKKSLARAIFPLYRRSKQELRQKAAEIGLPLPEARESQEICFVPNDDYRAFLQANPVAGVRLGGEGPVKLACADGGGQEIARHRGLWQYTEGQRRGLGIAWSEPLYVLAKDVAVNALIVGPGSELRAVEFQANALNLLVPPELWPEALLVRVRYRQKAVPARVKIAGDTMRVRFETPETPPAKGQLAVVYHPEGFILGGGIIC